jgi:hypothetical protein
MEYKSNGCYTALYKALQMIGGASDTSHYVEVLDAYTGEPIERIQAEDSCKTSGTLAEVLKFARAEGGNLCAAGLDARTDAGRTIWTVTAYYTGIYGRNAVTRGDPEGAKAGPVLAYKWDKAARVFVWDTDAYARSQAKRKGP